VACYRDGVQELEDAALARQVAAGHSAEADAAEAEIVRRFAPRIRLFGLRRLRDRTAAQDLVQEVLVTTIEALRAGRIQQPDRLASFVLGACRMTVANHRRGEQRRARLLAQFAHELEPAPVPPVGAQVDRERLTECLGGLPDRDRTVLALTFYAERSAEEIARELGTSSGNVRVVRHRALARLQDCLEALP
jgi:RNA polymerase sigma-70 factor, ECF subfamily